MSVEIIFSLSAALILTFCGSRWIDFLYTLPTAPLSFPQEISSRACFRKPILTFLMFTGIFNFASVKPPMLFYLTAAIFFLSLITFTDFEQYVIFDRMLLPFAIVGIIAVFHLHLPLLDRILAATIGGGIFFFIAVVTKGGVGGGDIKLVAVLGIWLGSKVLLNVIIFGSIFGGIFALFLMLTEKKDRKSYFAYGPYFTLTAMYFLSESKILS